MLRLDLLEALTRRLIQNAIQTERNYLEILGCYQDDYELPFFLGRRTLTMHPSGMPW